MKAAPPPPPPAPRISPLGDSALTITWPGEFRAETQSWLRWVMTQIQGWGTVEDVLPSYTTLSVFYSPYHVDYETIARQVQQILEAPSGNYPLESGRDFRIPVVYDGPDLDDVAKHTGLTTAEVIARHSSRWYDVYVVGFAPGWAYLGELDPTLVLPRRPTPRPRVPAGSVAIAARQTGVYPFALPGGWHLIGRTDQVMFDPTRAEPALLRVGDRVWFEPTR